jgi:hypothetical protein
MSMHMYMSCYVMYSMLHEHMLCACVCRVCVTLVTSSFTSS